MRLACYGWVDAEAGSVGSANFLLLRELLARGVEVDFFANEDHVPRPPGLNDSRFHYLGVRPPRPYRSLPPRMQQVINWVLEPMVRRAWGRIYGPIVSERRRQGGDYEAVLSLGTPPAFEIAGVPTVTWLQGPPTAEIDAIRRLRAQIVSSDGTAFWRALVHLYSYRLAVSRGALRLSDRLICGSSWARDLMIADGLPASKIEVLPYPVDLDLFRPEPMRRLDSTRPTILWLGRVDPRKRLDLLVSAFDLVLGSHPGAHLRIVGRPGYGRRPLHPIERSPHRARITYERWIPRSAVPSALRSSSLLVQTSENENFGSSVAEALACGVPVVVGARNGTSEYVDGGCSVFERYTPDAVASAISATLSAQMTDANSISRRVRAAAVQQFAPRVITDRLLKILSAARAEARTPVPSNE